MKKLNIRERDNGTRQHRFRKRNIQDTVKKVELICPQKTNRRYTKAKIDSINLTDGSLISRFFYNKNYKIVIIKRRGYCNNKLYIKTYGKSLFNRVNGRGISPYTEVYTIQHINGIEVPLKVPNSSKKQQTVEFAGLERYDTRSKKLNIVLCELWEDLQYSKLNRIDVCVDFKKRIPAKVIKTLKKSRDEDIYLNSKYFKTKHQKKRNSVVNIIIYDKSKKEKNYSMGKLIRMEFQFYAPFFNKMRLKDFQKAIHKIETRINKNTSLNIKVMSLS